MGLGQPIILSGTLIALLWLNFASFVWRAIWRFGFTMREYGWRKVKEGVTSVEEVLRVTSEDAS